jgi:integrase
MPLPREDNMATQPTPIRASAHHHGYKSWTSSWYDDMKRRRTKRFGRTDEIARKVAQARYRNWLKNEWDTKNTVRNPMDPSAYTVNKLAAAYRDHALTLYRKAGEPTSHIDTVDAAMNALAAKYDGTPADEIGAPEVKRLLDTMIVGEDRHGVTRVRSVSTINGRLRIIKQAFRWARLYGLVTKETAYDVSFVPPLRVGRTDAKAPRRVLPVPEAVLDATLAVATPTIGDMIRTLLLTGMRPGELCGLRACDIERDGDVWLYRPTSHKTEHHGKERIILIGPQAQAILKPYIARRTKLSEFVFLPSEAHRERLEQIGFDEVTAYQVSRSTFKPGRCFQHDTFYGQVCRTCDRAFDADGAKRKAKDYAHRWHPHRLRHNAATRVREQFGIEAAKDLLGHSSLSTAMIYAERSMDRMKEIARMAG